MVDAIPVIRFGWDYGVRVPLWDAEGLLPEQREWLRNELGLSDALITDLASFGERMNALNGTRVGGTQRRRMAEAGRALAGRVREELDGRFQVEYDEWR